MTADHRGDLSAATREAERTEAESPHMADRAANPDEEAVLDEDRVDEDVRRHHQDMDERGATVRGEGQIP
ncbi:MAG TPA: hypothetical protein VL961_13545 [Acidimicrobiales bacterium]|nr:hypothetical protein [Acidimicrobiales bacterium]